MLQTGSGTRWYFKIEAYSATLVALSLSFILLRVELTVLGHFDFLHLCRWRVFVTFFDLLARELGLEHVDDGLHGYGRHLVG